MSETAESRPLDEIDLQIIVALCLGMNQESAGNWICTPDCPSGVSERTVRNRIARNRAAYDRLRQRLGEAFHRKEVEIEALSKDKYREKLADLRSKGFRVKEIALDQAIANPYHTDFLTLGVKVADSVEDRDFGKAKQIHEHEGDVNVNHRIWGKPQPAEVLAAQDADIASSQRLLAAVSADVLEGELVTP